MLHIVNYHGNCPDGFSAYALYHAWATARGDTVIGYPVAPHDPRTWPALLPTGTWTAVFLDVVLDAETMRRWFSEATHTLVIDHHGTSEAFLDEFRETERVTVLFSHTSCAAILTHQHLYPGTPVPDWLWHVDRVDRWSGVTDHDVALREYILPIARLPVSDPAQADKALGYMASFIRRYSEGGTPMLEIIAESDKRLAKKRRLLHAILMDEKRASRIAVDGLYCEEAGLSPVWEDQMVFAIDTTGLYAFDSTLASYFVFAACPEVTVFTNYIRVGPEKYKYCVRSRDFDVTSDGLFFGHPCAAGGVLESPKTKTPFVVR
jgi:hypothetical protein